MRNFIRLLPAKLLLDLQQGSSFAQTFLSKIVFADFSKKIQLGNLKNDCKIKLQTIIFVIVFLEIRYSFLKRRIAYSL